MLWLLAMATAVGFAMARGTISLRGMLRQKSIRGLGGLSPARVQLMLISLTAAAIYVGTVFGAPPSPPGRLPSVPAWLLVGVGVSNGIYLTAKVASVRLGRARRRN